MARCGVVLSTDPSSDGPFAIADVSFVWLPSWAQCKACMRRPLALAYLCVTGEPRRPVGLPYVISATETMQTIVETIVLAIHRIGQPAEHRCHHQTRRYGIPGLTRCTWHTCRGDRVDFAGTRSWLDIIEWWYPVVGEPMPVENLSAA